MQTGGDRYRSCLNLAVGADKLLDGAETPASEFAGNCVCSGNIGIDHAHQPHRLILFGKLVIDARVVATERPHADDCDVNCVFVFQCAKSFYLLSC